MAQQVSEPKKEKHSKKKEGPTPSNDYDTKMALAEIMDAKTELLAERKQKREALAQKEAPKSEPIKETSTKQKSADGLKK